jgi:hypothetical protein
MFRERSSTGLMAFLRLAVAPVEGFRPLSEFDGKVGERDLYVGVGSLIREPQTIDCTLAKFHRRRSHGEAPDRNCARHDR